MSQLCEGKLTDASAAIAQARTGKTRRTNYNLMRKVMKTAGTEAEVRADSSL
ncbi:MAG: hypothetical protein ACLRSW_16500 [Christensenellaceae bacterium]